MKSQLNLYQDLDAVTQIEQNRLHEAVNSHKTGDIARLIQSGVSPFEKNSLGQRPLDVLFDWGNYQV